MGNRGGRLHTPDKTLGGRRWASKAWIACRVKFRERQREVMGRGYTELFFLDETTALAAGHRPCFECRRADALAFAQAWALAKGLERPPKAGEMDATLHAERLARRGRRRLRRGAITPVRDAPAGAMLLLWGGVWLATEHYLLRWSFRGYRHAVERRGVDEKAFMLTPPSIVAALRAGYRPHADTLLI